jgi:hypothetical protein
MASVGCGGAVQKESPKITANQTQDNPLVRLKTQALSFQ